jgi:hypothetical protein
VARNHCAAAFLFFPVVESVSLDLFLEVLGGRSLILGGVFGGFLVGFPAFLWGFVVDLWPVLFCDYSFFIWGLFLVRFGWGWFARGLHFGEGLGSGGPLTVRFWGLMFLPLVKGLSIFG